LELAALIGLDVVMHILKVGGPPVSGNPDLPDCSLGIEVSSFCMKIVHDFP
jgi:hypothetical protein